MTLRLHPDLIAAGYSYLRECPPFKGWHLPEADEVGFHVVADPKKYADFYMESGQPNIRVSEHGLGVLGSILPDIAHEMIHLHQQRKKLARGVEHNADFKRRAKRICALHGFDPRTF